MTHPVEATSATAVPATVLLERVRADRSTRDAAEVRLLLHALAWAELHVVAPPAPEPVQVPHLEQQPSYGRSHADVLAEREQLGLPELAWDAAASFAAALGLSTAAGDRLLRDALILALRLPRTFTRVVAGEVPVWRARRIAEACLGQPSDVVTYLDQEAAPTAEKVGVVMLDRIIDAAMLAMYPEERELAQLDALDHRHVTLHEESMNHTGIADMSIRGDWADLAAFNDTVADIAAIIGCDGAEAEHESLDSRRSIAVGILADPARAVALLGGVEAPPATRTRLMRVVAHLTEANLAGLTPVATDDQGRGFHTDLFTRWAGRPDTKVHLQPLLHCGGCPDCSHDVTHEALDVYVPSARDKIVVQSRDRQCQFPYCHRSATRCDHDHRVAFDDGGDTCPCNLTLLCRHHHRLKTFAGWGYTAIEPGVYLWTDRYGQQFIRTRDGTEDVSGDPPGSGG